jgi:hypothetical protein
MYSRRLGPPPESRSPSVIPRRRSVSISAPFASIRPFGKDNLSEYYTIDDGINANPTAADPVFGGTTIIRNQVASVQESHVFHRRW